jgi:prefoldin subunit 5
MFKDDKAERTREMRKLSAEIVDLKSKISSLESEINRLKTSQKQNQSAHDQ